MHLSNAPPGSRPGAPSSKGTSGPRPRSASVSEPHQAARSRGEALSALPQAGSRRDGRCPAAATLAVSRGDLARAGLSPPPPLVGPQPGGCPEGPGSPWIQSSADSHLPEAGVRLHWGLLSAERAVRGTQSPDWERPGGMGRDRRMPGQEEGGWAEGRGARQVSPHQSVGHILPGCAHTHSLALPLHTLSQCTRACTHSLAHALPWGTRCCRVQADTNTHGPLPPCLHLPLSPLPLQPLQGFEGSLTLGSGGRPEKLKPSGVARVGWDTGYRGRAGHQGARRPCPAPMALKGGCGPRPLTIEAAGPGTKGPLCCHYTRLTARVKVAERAPRR